MTVPALCLRPIAGKIDYGVRVAHGNHPSSGVSIVRSKGVDRLQIAMER